MRDETFIKAKSRCCVKVKASVRRVCSNCKIIKRHGILRVICTNPKHKQRQG